MPKKRTFNFKQLQGSSSSNKQIATKNGDEVSSQSVNDRLSELRKIEGKDAAAKKRQLADSVNQRSVPPDVRGILGISECAPPKPKAGVRARERMRTPGPAPPKSWLASSSVWTPSLALRGRKRGTRKTDANKTERSKPNQLLRFARLAGLEDDTTDRKPSSLTHLALKTIAESWDLFDEEDYPALAEIPLRLRLRLLSYIGFYGPSIDSGALSALLQGSEVVHHVDLTGLVGNRHLPLKKVVRLLELEQQQTSNKQEVGPAESWDMVESLEISLQPSLPVTRFSQLTHLCLSHPAPTVSWRDLLALSKFTPQLTHLSLAHWPRPTLTPNLATATVSSQHGPDVTAGGSHYYSNLDQDMSEPASLLRQLSGNLLCLQWLDLESCGEWIAAVARLARILPSVNSVAEWTNNSTPEPSIFVTNWKNLTYLRCAQGWLPSLIGVRTHHESRDTPAIDQLLFGGITKHLQSVSGFNAIEASSGIVEVERKRARAWMEREYALTFACMQINETRRAHGCRPVTTDVGWMQRHVGNAGLS